MKNEERVFTSPLLWEIAFYDARRPDSSICSSVITLVWQIGFHSTFVKSDAMQIGT